MILRRKLCTISVVFSLQENFLQGNPLRICSISDPYYQQQHGWSWIKEACAHKRNSALEWVVSVEPSPVLVASAWKSFVIWERGWQWWTVGRDCAGDTALWWALKCWWCPAEWRQGREQAWRWVVEKGVRGADSLYIKVLFAVSELDRTSVLRGRWTDGRGVLGKTPAIV